jgi:AcrR family transcriptional regulator
VVVSTELAFCGSDRTGEPPSVQRIREAALKISAVRGAEATSMRMVGAAAGVSIGLVQHHFGTKAGLFQAVDEYVIRVLGEVLSGPLPAAPADPVVDVAQRVTSLIAEKGDVVDYVCRSLIDSTPTGVRIFDSLVEIAAGHWDQLRQQGLTQADLDPIWVSLNPLILVLGIFMLRSHLSRHLPEAFATPTQLRRWQDATEALIANGQLKRPGHQLPSD